MRFTAGGVILVIILSLAPARRAAALAPRTAEPEAPRGLAPGVGPAAIPGAGEKLGPEAEGAALEYYGATWRGAIVILRAAAEEESTLDPSIRQRLFKLSDDYSARLAALVKEMQQKRAAPGDLAPRVAQLLREFAAESKPIVRERAGTPEALMRRMDVVGIQYGLVAGQTMDFVRLLASLGLTKAQKEQIATVLGERDEQLDRARAAYEPAARAQRDMPSDPTHAAQIRAYTRLEATTHALAHAARKKVYDALTAEQKARLDEVTLKVKVEGQP